MSYSCIEVGCRRGSVFISVRKGFNLPFRPLAVSRKGRVSLTTNCTLLSRRDRPRAWWSTRLWVRELYPFFVQDIAGRRGVSSRKPLPSHIPPTSSAASCDPRLLPKVSLHRGPSIVSSRETPRRSTNNVMVSFSRAPLNLTIALFITVFSKFWRSCRSFFPRCAWRACESFDWTRDTTPTHTPPIPRLVWLSSFSLSGWVGNGSSHCSRCSTPPALAPPASRPLLLAPFLLLLPLRPIESLSLPLEGPLPPLGLPTNCPLHSLFGFS